ncbi:MAG: formylglycine-generating enzyme family protein, partial [Nitrospinota bacterium]
RRLRALNERGDGLPNAAGPSQRSRLTFLWVAISVAGAVLPVQAADLKSPQVRTIGPEAARMVYISAGPFLIRVGLERPPETPIQGVEWRKRVEGGRVLYDVSVTTGSFFIDRYEVSNLQYSAFMKSTGHRAPRFWDDSRFNALRQPVVGVSYYDAERNCRWAGKRLPTETEWEKAARGTDGRSFPWGNAERRYPNPLDRANFNPIIRTGVDYYTTDFSADGHHYPAPVDAFPHGASPFGVFQMAGNVAEWVSHPYRLGARNEKQRFPLASGSWGLQKGGAWVHLLYRLLATDRRWSDKGFTHDFAVGFRCARDS